MWHVTARMAWHDNGWDGRICDNPAANTYCTGNHSLLSERIAREKSPDPNKEKAREPLDFAMPAYLPPCFWTSCAFAEDETDTVHRHPFRNLKDKKHITGSLRPYSIYTWPFRLSITQSRQAKKRHGQYFPDLEARIERFCQRLTPQRSLVFFYLNYDNPVSADDYKYTLVGCARLEDLDVTGSFEFDDKELAKIRDGDSMENFPTLNWAIQLTHGGPGAFVRLPYQEYLKHIERHPEDEPKLQEMRVLVDEPGLLPDFKYVSEQVNDDHCLALLYKLKRAFRLVDEHGIAEVSADLDLLDQFIEEAWQARGLYPGLGSVVSVLSDLAEGEPQKENYKGAELVEEVRALYSGDEDDVFEHVFGLLSSKEPVPDVLASHRSTIRDARAGLKDNSRLTPTLQKLSLFALTPRQVARILFPDSSDGAHGFGGKDIRPAEIEKNPYLLCENYVAATEVDKERSEDFDREQKTDGAIDYFTIDIGMFPDSRFVERRDDLHDLTVAGPERLRAFAIEALRRNEELGHSFAPLAVLVEEAVAHPLFYRDSIALRPEQLTSSEHLEHFRQSLFILEFEGGYYFYLQETKNAEEIVRRFVDERLSGSDHIEDLAWIEPHLTTQAEELDALIDGFDSESFVSERRHLMEGASVRRLYCVTGRPGAGKTQALRTLLDYFEECGETTTVLAPTGKAALRLSEKNGSSSDWEAQTIDRWLFRSGLGTYVSGGASITSMGRSDKYEETDNLVIDEMSMVDLHHLALVFRAIEVHQAGSIKRIILVGDENQLPPIGCGRPFHDIIAYLREDGEREHNFLVRLTTNCRQQHDSVVLNAAHLFAGKNRYHTELYEQLLAGGQISDYLRVAYWETPEQLQALVREYVGGVLDEAVEGRHDLTDQSAFNELLGLYENGFVPKNNAIALSLDRAQIITPYRGGPSGSLGLSSHVREQYRAQSWPDRHNPNSSFGHSDKIIRRSNYYGWNNTEKRMELRLSNGSIGVLCNNKGERKAYFPESEWPVSWWRMDEEDFELAYGITVHKAQGSEFQEVMVVIPERRALLTRELVYTALTRSRTKLVLLVQKTPRENPLTIARERSDLLRRNSSTFTIPFDARNVFEPEPGVNVKSKIEYLIYRTLQQARDEGMLTFSYEEELALPINGREIIVHPDFTVQVGGRVIYWEHLGMLDRQDYSRDWRERRKGYEAVGLGDALLTTDDLSGVGQERLQTVIQDIIEGSLRGDDDGSEFSKHHYTL